MNEFFRSYYSSSGRLTRVQYLGRHLLLNFILLAFYLVDPNFYLVYLALAIYCNYYLVQQRLRDMDYDTTKTFFWMLSFLIPLVNIVTSLFLLLTPSRKELL